MKRKNSDEKNHKTVKKNRGELAVKFMSVLCIIAAIVLAGVILAGLGKNIINVDATTDLSDNYQSTQDLVGTNLPTSDISTSQPEVYEIYYAKDETQVMSLPSVNSTILGVLTKDDTVEFVSEEIEGWCKIIYNNTTCYVKKDFLTNEIPETTESTTAANISPVTGRKIIDPNAKIGFLIVVDKNREIPEGYVPQLEYVADSEYEMDYRVAPYYDKMYEAALEDGIELTPYSGYRSYERQKENYEYLVEEYMYSYDMTQEEAEAEAAKEILPPGTSEHNLGYAMDICGTEENFSETDEYAWLVEHAHEYGFIERYTEEKQDITGIIPEPWHWRFVSPRHAIAIKESGLCLEEYLEKYNVSY